MRRVTADHAGCTQASIQQGQQACAQFRATTGSSLPAAICGLCSALVAVADEGELRHAVFHEATATIASPWTTA
jgi:hypothetical protein